MNNSSANSSLINGPARCQHRTASGKRCRLRALDTRTGLCFRHSSQHSELLHARDLRATLAGDVAQFDCAGDINKFLSNLLLLLSEDRVAPRRAAVMAYTCNLLLRTLSFRDDTGSDEPRALVDFGDLPRPDRSSISPSTSFTPSHASSQP